MAAKMPKMSAFLKPADSTLVPMTTSDMVTESNSALISPEVAVDKDVGTEQNSTSEENTITVKLPIDSAIIRATPTRTKKPQLLQLLFGAILEFLLNR